MWVVLILEIMDRRIRLVSFLTDVIFLSDIFKKEGTSE